MFERIWARMLRAAQLDASLYNEVEADENATTEALIVVVLTAICAAIGSAFSGEGRLFSGVLGSISSVVVGWVVMSATIYLVGVNLFGGKATFGELLRTLGYASAPGVLRILTFVPWLGGLIGFVVAIWTLATNVVAIREALDVETTQAILTGVIGLAAWIIVLIVFGLLFGGTMLGIGVLASLFR